MKGLQYKKMEKFRVFFLLLLALHVQPYSSAPISLEDLQLSAIEEPVLEELKHGETQQPEDEDSPHDAGTFPAEDVPLDTEKDLESQDQSNQELLTVVSEEAGIEAVEEATLDENVEIDPPDSEDSEQQHDDDEDVPVPVLITENSEDHTESETEEENLIELVGDEMTPAEVDQEDLIVVIPDSEQEKDQPEQEQALFVSSPGDEESEENVKEDLVQIVPEENLTTNIENPAGVSEEEETPVIVLVEHEIGKEDETEPSEELTLDSEGIVIASVESTEETSHTHDEELIPVQSLQTEEEADKESVLVPAEPNVVEEDQTSPAAEDSAQEDIFLVPVDLDEELLEFEEAGPGGTVDTERGASEEHLGEEGFVAILSQEEPVTSEENSPSTFEEEEPIILVPVAPETEVVDKTGPASVETIEESPHDDQITDSIDLEPGELEEIIPVSSSETNEETPEQDTEEIDSVVPVVPETEVVDQTGPASVETIEESPHDDHITDSVDLEPEELEEIILVSASETHEETPEQDTEEIDSVVPVVPETEVVDQMGPESPQDELVIVAIDVELEEDEETIPVGYSETDEEATEQHAEEKDSDVLILEEPETEDVDQMGPAAEEIIPEELEEMEEVIPVGSSEIKEEVPEEHKEEEDSVILVPAESETEAVDQTEPGAEETPEEYSNEDLVIISVDVEPEEDEIHPVGSSETEEEAPEEKTDEEDFVVLVPVEHKMDEYAPAPEEETPEDPEVVAAADSHEQAIAELLPDTQEEDDHLVLAPLGNETIDESQEETTLEPHHEEPPVVIRVEPTDEEPHVEDPTLTTPLDSSEEAGAEATTELEEIIQLHPTGAVPEKHPDEKVTEFPTDAEAGVLPAAEEEKTHSIILLVSKELKTSLLPVQDEPIALVNRGAILGAALFTLVGFIVVGFVGLTISKKLR